MAENEAELTEIPVREILDKIQKGEQVEYDDKLIEGDLDIRSLALTKDSNGNLVINSNISITNSRIDGDVIFDNATFKRHANFRKTHFTAVASFVNVEFNGFHNISDNVVNFEGAKFDDLAHFFRARFNGGANFKETQFSASGGYIDRARFSDYALFDNAQFDGDAYFKKTLFCGLTRFRSVQFKGHTHFRYVQFRQSAYFEKAQFNEPLYLDETKFNGDRLTFRNAVFSDPSSQEEACRRAKNVLAKAGNRDEEEYHFYREMDAKRIQKGIRGNSELGLDYWLKTDTWSFWRFFLHDVLEWFFVQKIFGYGVHPFRLFGWWLAFVAAFAIIYSIKGGIEEPEVRQWYDYFWFSVATAATPGYALYKPVGMFKFLAGIEAILGTFMWAAFITTFARKFMR